MPHDLFWLQRVANEMQDWGWVEKSLGKGSEERGAWWREPRIWKGEEQQVEPGPASEEAKNSIASALEEVIADEVEQQVETRWRLFQES